MAPINMKTDPYATDYVAVKRDRKGTCNICLNSCELKWDHVPPQGGVDVKPMDQYTILERLAGRSNAPNRLFTQNGVKYRTLCQDCNSKLLGGQYDRTLNDFALGVGHLLTTSLVLPRDTEYVTKPARLLRSLFGHLLAAKATVGHTKPDEAMRHFVLDPTARLPTDLNVFYWVYPYPEVHIIRDVVMPSRYAASAPNGIFSMLKYFPVAYLVTNLKAYEGLISLSFHCPSAFDDEVRLPICLADVKPPRWPDDGSNIIAGTEAAAHSSVSAIPTGTSIRAPSGQGAQF